jgi:sporulation protein YlmC with PRC-barrel domain
MIDEGNGVLVRLSGSGHTVADPTDDVRGRPVLDESGAKLGTVEDLLVDTERRRIRFLRVVRGGILGWGAMRCYIPANAVVHAGAAVLVRTSDEPSQSTLGYDPRLAPEPSDVGASLDHLAFAPYWVPGYLPPIYRTWRRAR